MSQVRHHVFYSGQVQGVGFRYNAVRCARGHDVAGFVRNLPDGRVELVVEGSKRAVEGLLADIHATMGANIHEVDTQTGDPTGEFDDFHIGM